MKPVEPRAIDFIRRSLFFLLHAKCRMHSADWSLLMIFQQKIDGALLALSRKRLRFSRILKLSCPSCSGFIHPTENRTHKTAPQFPPAHSEDLLPAAVGMKQKTTKRTNNVSPTTYCIVTFTVPIQLEIPAFTNPAISRYYPLPSKKLSRQQPSIEPLRSQERWIDGCNR